MPFALRCPGCNAVLKAPDKAAGRTLNCPGCKTPVTFPNRPRKFDDSPPAEKPRLAPTVTKRNADEVPATKLPNLSLDTTPVKADPPKPAPASPPKASIDSLSDLDDFPALLGDEPVPKPAPKPAAKAPAPKVPDLSLDPTPAAKASTGSLLPDLDGDFPSLLGDDPAPAPKPIQKPAPAPKALAAKMPNLSLDDAPALVEDSPPAPKKAAIPNLSLDDPPLVDDKPKAKSPARPKMELEEELPVLDEAEDITDGLDEVIPVGEDDFDELEEIEEEELPVAELDEEEEEEERRPARRDSYLDESKLMRLRLVHIKPQKVSFGEMITKQDNAGYDLCDPESRRRLGEAAEVREGAQQAIRYLVGRSIMETRVEIREGKRGDVLAVIRRPPYLWESSLEILDPDGRVLGVFAHSPLATLTAATLWIKTKSGKKLLQMKPKTWEGKMLLMTKAGEPVGEMLSESAYEKKLKIYWMTRGCGYYIRFNSVLDDRPEDKIRFLAAVIGLDLFNWEHMN